MEKNNRDSKIISILAICITVVAISLGFAAFSTTLSIEPVYDDKKIGEVNIDFSSSDSFVDTSDVLPIKSSNSIYATNAKIDNSVSPKVTGLSANFTEPGQSVKYIFYISNSGLYDAYLKNITYMNVSGRNSFRICIPGEGASDGLVQVTCNDISLSVEVDNSINTSGSISDLSYKIAKQTFQKIVVTIEYSKYGNRADGPFSVQFGDVYLRYDAF